MLVNLILCSLACAALANNYCLPTQSCWPSDAEVAALDQELAKTGAVLLKPGDGDWPGNSLTYNIRVGETPGLIAFVGSVDQIREVMKFVKKFNIRLSIVSSGHSFIGRNTAEGSFQLSVHNMRNVSTDMDCPMHKDGCLIAQPGVQFLEVYKIASEAGRVVVGGNAPTVSVTGWTLGGGHSALSRMFGLGAHNALEFTLVTYDLSLVTTNANGTTIQYVNGTKSKTSDTELFWALRGGGSAFGVVTELKIKLHRAPDKVGQMTCYYTAFGDGTPKLYEVVLKAFRDFLRVCPNNFGGYLIPSVTCNMGQPCSAGFLISFVHYGSQATDPYWVQKAIELPHQFVEFQPGGCQLKEWDTFYDYAKAVVDATYVSAYIAGSLVQQDRMSDEYIKAVAGQFNESYYEHKNLSATYIALGGAVTDVPIGEVPVHPGWKGAQFTMTFGVTAYRGTKQGTDAISFAKDSMRKVAKYGYGKYYNEAEGDLSPAEWKREFWGNEIYAKLLRIKQKWDPTKMFTCKECVGDDWEPQN